MMTNFAAVVCIDLAIRILYYTPQVQEELEGGRQRWFYGGKLLGDQLVVSECGVQHNHVIQAIITPQPLTSVDS